MHPVYPQHPRQLPQSKWTSAPGAHTYCHWEVEQVQTKSGQVILRATLDPHQRLILPWRELRDRSRWLPGWS